jgi:hypothetical protein
VLAALLLIFLAQPAFSFEKDAGSICVDPLPKPIEGRRAAGRGSVRCDAEKYSFKIDAQPLRPWPKKEAIKIENVDMAAHHRVTVFCGGKAMESATFHFSEIKTRRLCLFLNDLYWTIQIWEAKSAPWCRCK